MNTDQLIAKRAACGCCHGRAGVIIDGKEWKLVPVQNYELKRARSVEEAIDKAMGVWK